MGTEQAIVGKDKPITPSNKLAWRSFGQLAWRSLDTAGMAQLEAVTTAAKALESVIKAMTDQETTLKE